MRGAGAAPAPKIALRPVTLRGHARRVFGLFLRAPCGAVTSLSRLGVRRTGGLVATPLRAGLVCERAARVLTKTATTIAWRTLASLFKTGLRALERRIKRVVKTRACRCRAIESSAWRVAITATEAAAITAETTITLASFEGTETAFRSRATVCAASVERPLKASGARYIFRPLETITAIAAVAASSPPAGRTLVFNARQAAFARCAVALKAGCAPAVQGARRVMAHVEVTALAAVVMNARTICRRTVKRALATEATAARIAATITAGARRRFTIKAATSGKPATKATAVTTIATTATVATATTTEAATESTG